MLWRKYGLTQANIYRKCWSLSVWVFALQHMNIHADVHIENINFMNFYLFCWTVNTNLWLKVSVTVFYNQHDKVDDLKVILHYNVIIYMKFGKLATQPPTNFVA